MMSNRAGPPPVKGKLPLHVLKTAVGVVIEATLDPTTFQMVCNWQPGPPYSRKKLARIAREYIPWRDNLMNETALRAGLRVVVVTPDINGVPVLTVLGRKDAIT